jgi:plasmid maintenance system antidote protein VapI
MPAQVTELIQDWRAARDELVRLRSAFPEERQLDRPLLSQGVWRFGAVPPQFNSEWESWLALIEALMEKSQAFFNYHCDMFRFTEARFYQGCYFQKPRFRFDDCLRSMNAMLELLGWHDKTVGELVNERMDALKHKQEALAEAMGVASSTLGRIRAGKTTPSPPVRAALRKYLAGELAGFSDKIESITHAS